MFTLDRDQDTICAVSTANGYGAIAVVRLSGPQAFEVIRQSASFLPRELESHKVYYGFIKDVRTQTDLDEVLVTYFEKGRSFTGEDTFEVSCHGNPLISQALLEVFVSCGARMAQRGEFTYRAFINGRLDLTQAESVLSLIESQSKIGTRMALRQLRGDLGRCYKNIQNNLVWCLSRLEANLDFAAEDIQIESDDKILKELCVANSEVQELLSSFKAGRIAKDGFRVVLAGAPNVGKSSLVNALSEEDRSIVSDRAGTTRDTIETTINLNGKKIDIVDTAGLRESVDEIEMLGIERTKKNLLTADLILWVCDAHEAKIGVIEDWIGGADAEVVVVFNKSDLLGDEQRLAGHLYTSSKSGEGLGDLQNLIDEKTNIQSQENNIQVMVARQYELLKNISVNLDRGITLMKDKMSPEFIISEVNEALKKIMEISGQTFDDEVLDKVFGDFCLGK